MAFLLSVLRTLNFCQKRGENFTKTAFFFKLDPRFVLRNLFQERQTVSTENHLLKTTVIHQKRFGWKNYIRSHFFLH